MEIFQTILHVITFGCIVWTAATLTGILWLRLQDRKPKPPKPTLPTKPFQGRLALPSVDARPEVSPYRTIRSIDQGEVWWKEDMDSLATDASNLLYFDPSKRASFVARRLELVKRQNEANR